ncbi:MAG: DUF2188 domain-containing protein [Acidobacteriota bacterium]
MSATTTTPTDTPRVRSLQQAREALTRSIHGVTELLKERGGKTLEVVREQGGKTWSSVREKGGETAETVRDSIRERGGSLLGSVAASGKVLGRRAGEGLHKAGERLRPAARTLGEKAEKATVSLFHTLGLPHLDDLQELNRRIEELTVQVDRLVRQEAPASARAPAPIPAQAERTAEAAAELEHPFVYHVRKVERGWAVELEGEPAPESIHGNKKGALEAARALAHEHLPSRLVIHRMDGSVQDEASFEAD